MNGRVNERQYFFTITFVKFQLVKYECDIYKGFFMENMTQIC